MTGFCCLSEARSLTPPETEKAAGEKCETHFREAGAADATAGGQRRMHERAADHTRAPSAPGLSCPPAPIGVFHIERAESLFPALERTAHPTGSAHRGRCAAVALSPRLLSWHWERYLIFFKQSWVTGCRGAAIPGGDAAVFLPRRMLFPFPCPRVPVCDTCLAKRLQRAPRFPR